MPTPDRPGGPCPRGSRALFLRLLPGALFLLIGVNGYLLTCHDCLAQLHAALLAIAALLTLWLRHALASARQRDAQMGVLLTSQAQLITREQRFRDIAESSSDWLWEVDAHGHLTYLSERFTPITGEQREHWLGKPLAELLMPQAGSLHAWLAQTNNAAQVRDRLQCHYQDSAGRQRICTLTCSTIGDPQGHRGTVTDITEAAAAQAEARHLSLHDALTGLPNRYQLHHYLAEYLGQAQCPPMVLLSLDLDRFKPINDALGHAVGDRVLQEVARRLNHRVQACGMVARLGGDEFIVALPRAMTPAQVDTLCGQLVEDLCQPFELGLHSAFIGTSIGIALAPDHAQTAAELLRMGDIALYAAKAAGRNTWRLYAEAMSARLLARQQLEQELHHALACDQLRLRYQPRYATIAGGLCSFEALVRWEHPEQGLVMPDAFINLAEDTGLIRPLGRWVLENACREAMTWPANIGLSVNLSPGQFNEHEDIVAIVDQVLRSTGLPARRLELEITERLLLEPAPGVVYALKALRERGVRISLDDFGTGFSSLTYLRNYPLDGIKIDRSFITHLTAQGNDQAIVRAMIGLGHSLGIKVTAEGVETLAQLEYLRTHPCDEVQGFHFSAALPPEELRGLFAREMA